MKTKIQLIVFITTFLSVNINAQILKDLAKKAKDAVKIENINQATKIVSNGKNTADKMINPPSVLTFTSNNKINKITISSEELICGPKNAPHHMLRSNDVIFFKYWDAVNALNCTSDEQAFKNSPSKESIGSWQMAFLTTPKYKTVSFIFNYSDSVLNFINNKNVTSQYIKRTLKGDSVYNYIAKSKDEYNKIYFKEIGNYEGRFSEGKFFDKDGQIICEYEGNNTFELMQMYYARIFKIASTTLSDILDQAVIAKEGIVSEAKQKIRNAEIAKEKEAYLKTTKNCKYCNKPYTGISFELLKSKDKYKPCSGQSQKVYYDAFCTMKCALEWCQNSQQ